MPQTFFSRSGMTVTAPRPGKLAFNFRGFSVPITDIADLYEALLGVCECAAVGEDAEYVVGHLCIGYDPSLPNPVDITVIGTQTTATMDVIAVRELLSRLDNYDMAAAS